MVLVLVCWCTDVVELAVHRALHVRVHGGVWVEDAGKCGGRWWYGFLRQCM